MVTTQNRLVPGLFLNALLCCAFVPSAAAQTYQVQVVGGYGSGGFETGKTVHIWASPPPSGQVFVGWAGDVNLLQDPNAWHTALVMPLRNASFTATYKASAAIAPVTAVVNGSNYLYAVPQPHIGVVVHFHGSGESGSSFFSQTEQAIFANELVAAGYAVISGDSVNRNPKEWDISTATATNRDAANVKQILAELTAQNVLGANDALFFHGISDGGYFSTLICTYFHATAEALDIAEGLSSTPNLTVPTIWTLMQNDRASGNAGIGPDAVRMARLYSLAISARGVPSEYHVQPPSPLYPERFARIPGTSVTASQAIYAALQQAGFVDANGLVTTDPYLPAVQSFLAQTYGASFPPIADELKNCFAEHSFADEMDRDVISFFNATLNLPTVPVPPASGSPTVQATTFGGFKVAPDSIVATFGPGLSSATAVQVRDSAGVSANAALFAVVATQVNSLIPSSTAHGQATLTIDFSGIALLSSSLTIGAVAPGLFSANGDGQGPVAANILRVKANGSTSYESPVQYDAAQKQYVTVPVDLGPEGDSVYLVLYGSGLRHAISPASASLQIGGFPVKPSYLGPQGSLGLDQVNLLIPRTLIGAGVIDVMLAVDGECSNSLELEIK